MSNDIRKTSSPPKDKRLFTPGPLTTSATVKQAMLRDLGSRDFEFIEIVKDIRRRLVELGGETGNAYTAIPLQGSGTYALEAVVSSAIPDDKRLMVAVNGVYGKRLVHIAKIHDISASFIEYPEDQPVNPGDVAAILDDDPDLSLVAVCHCETTTGIINPIREIGAVVKKAKRLFFVDAMSSFGAIPIHLREFGIDYLVSSANKCIEGVPGFSFVIARRRPLLSTRGFARSVSLDLFEQYKGLEKNGQFRFTPPTHALLAFHRALIELEEEGGVEGRAARYRKNHETLVTGMRELGFREYLASEHQGYIITSFYYPKHPRFDFDEFYRRLNERGHVIYPGKVGRAKCFRIGSIGRIFQSDILELLDAIRRVLAEMGVTVDKET